MKSTDVFVREGKIYPLIRMLAMDFKVGDMFLDKKTGGYCTITCINQEDTPQTIEYIVEDSPEKHLREWPEYGWCFKILKND